MGGKIWVVDDTCIECQFSGELIIDVDNYIEFCSHQRPYKTLEYIKLNQEN
jgi:hypothetical protein